MKLLFILLTAMLCALASAQTIKTLGYNTTNWQVVANVGTNVLTFTNATTIDVASGSMMLSVSNTGVSVFSGAAGENILTLPSDDTPAFSPNYYWSEPSVRAAFGFSSNLNTLWTATNASVARSAVGLGATWLTNTNVTNFRTAVGLGSTNDVVFQSVQAGISDPFVDLDNLGLSIESTNTNTGASAITFVGDGASRMAANTRTNLGLPLATLTNDSNVKIMRALSGSTNTNHPYSGTVALTNTNAVLTFSNGILQSVQ